MDWKNLKEFNVFFKKFIKLFLIKKIKQIKFINFEKKNIYIFLILTIETHIKI